MITNYLYSSSLVTRMPIFHLGFQCVFPLVWPIHTFCPLDAGLIDT